MLGGCRCFYAMSLSDKQRAALIEQRGDPVLRLEFDVFADGEVSMWTHFDHGGDFEEVKQRLLAIKEHLTEFLKDENMCPFHNVKRVK